jgi:hypothetical protein
MSNEQNALVVLYRNYSIYVTRKDQREEVFRVSVDRETLSSDFCETLRPHLREFFRERVNELVHKYPREMALYENCARWWNSLAEEDEDVDEDDVRCEYLVLTENSSDLDELFYSERHSPTLPSDEHLPDFESVDKVALSSRILERVVNLMFQKTLAERHRGGFSLIAECTEFKPYGGYEDQGS